MTQIKLCGISRMCDIEAVNEVRPEYIGFVFAKKSRRYVSPEVAAQLKAALLPDIQTVGVFVDEPVEQVADLYRQGIIDIAQLHGGEDENYIQKLKTLCGCPVIKAFTVQNIIHKKIGSEQPFEKELTTMAAVTDEAEDAPKFATKAMTSDGAEDALDEDVLDIEAVEKSSADYVLLDSGAGSGETFAWDLIQHVKRPYFLAGGLGVENVERAISELHPFAVDVSSGIETDKVKDKAKMEAFVAAVRNNSK